MFKKNIFFKKIIVFLIALSILLNFTVILPAAAESIPSLINLDFQTDYYNSDGNKYYNSVDNKSADGNRGSNAGLYSEADGNKVMRLSYNLASRNYKDNVAFNIYDPDTLQKFVGKAGETYVISFNYKITCTDDKTMQFYVATTGRQTLNGSDLNGNQDAMKTPNWKFTPASAVLTETMDGYATASAIFNANGSDYPIILLSTNGSVTDTTQNGTRPYAEALVDNIRIATKHDSSVKARFYDGENDTTLTIDNSTTFDTLPVPSYSGHTFEGFYIDEDFNVKAIGSDLVENFDVIFVKWSLDNRIPVDVVNTFSTQGRIDEQVVFESGYSDATVQSSRTNLAAAMGDAFPVIDPLDEANKVIKFSQCYGTGFAIIGSNCEGNSNSISAEAITAQAGTTYNIQFDYYAIGKTSSNGTRVSFAVGSATGNGGSSLTPVFEENLIVLASDSDISTNRWIRNCKKTVTVPYDTVLDGTADKLLIRLTLGGKNAEIYIDNVKVTTVKKVKEESVAYNDYSKATLAKNRYTYPAAMGDTYATTDPFDLANNVIKYSQDWGTGFAIIGSDCEGNSDSISAEAITAKAGTTYNIEFDYYATGKTNSNGTQVSFAVGSATGNNSQPTAPVFEDKLLVLASNSDVSTGGWIRNYKKTVTVPLGTVLDGMANKLLIRFTYGGHKAAIYLDNLKVTKVLTTSNIVVSSKKDAICEDYSDSNIPNNPWTGFAATSGDIQPAIDPLDSNNKVLQLSKFRTNSHQIVIGSGYENPDAVKNCKPVTPVAGASYEIDFDWYAPENPQNGDIILYAAVGPKTFHTDTVYDFKTELLTIRMTDALTHKWQHIHKVFTIPDNVALTDGNILLLNIYSNIVNHTGNPCFDNISLKSVIPFGADITVGSNNNSSVYYNGKFPANDYQCKNNKAVMWYTGRTHSKGFAAHSFENQISQNVNVYGEYDLASTPFVLGDINADSEASASDLIVMKKYLLGVNDRFDSKGRADINTDGQYNIKDLIRQEKIISGSLLEQFSVNGNRNYTIVVPSADNDFTTRNKELVASYIGSAVLDTTSATDCEIIIGNANRNGTVVDLPDNCYTIVVKENKVYVNGGNENSLAAAIIALKGYMDAGYNFMEGCIIDFEYVGSAYPKDIIGVTEETISFSADNLTTKQSKTVASGSIAESVATISSEVSDASKEAGKAFANKIKENIISDFEKEGDLMVHVSSFAIINDVVYMTYYANTTTNQESPKYQIARFVYCPIDDLKNKTFIDLQSPGDECGGKVVEQIYDTILMNTDNNTLYLLWTSCLSGKYYRLYRTYTISTGSLGPIQVNKFKVGDIVNDFSTTGMTSALTENDIAYKNMYTDIGIMQKLSSRVENGETYYYSGSYCGDFNCIIKSKDLITWEYVSQPSFINQSKWENATYVVGDKCYYFVRQSNESNYGFLTYYDLVNGEWAKPVLVQDCQSRSDFIMYKGNLYLFHAPVNRETIGIIHVDLENLANSEVVLQAAIGDSCFYPFVQYSNTDSETLYMSYTVWRKHIRLVKFSTDVLEVNVLAGKQALFCGDSIAAGWRDTYKGKSDFTNASSSSGSWSGRIQDKYSMTVKNAAVAGSSLTSIANRGHIVSQLMANKSNKYEYVILQGGFNDAMGQNTKPAPLDTAVSVGTVSSSYNLKDFDLTTFAGSLEEYFYYATSYFNGAHIGFILTYATPNSEYGGRTADVDAMRVQWNVAKQICDKWGIAYLDLFDGVTPDKKSYSNNILNTDNVSSTCVPGSGDHIHLSTIGYDNITPYVADWMTTIPIYNLSTVRDD